MNLLIENAPDYIVVRGKFLKIDTSFSAWVRFLVAVDGGKDEDIVKAITDIFGEEIVCENPQEVIAACFGWLFQTNDKSGAKTAEKGGGGSVPFDYAVDGNVIYCELWEYFPHLMKRGISYHEGTELIKLLMHNDKTMLWHRAYARCGDFSKLDKEQQKYWQKQRAIWSLNSQSQGDIDAVMASAF